MRKYVHSSKWLPDFNFPVIIHNCELSSEIQKAVMWRREDITECCFIGQKQDQGELAGAPAENVGCSPTQWAVETWEACCHWKSLNCGHRTRCQYMIEKREDLFLWMVVVFDGFFQVTRNWNEFVLFAHPRCLLPSDKSILCFKWHRVPLPSSCVSMWSRPVRESSITRVTMIDSGWSCDPNQFKNTQSWDLRKEKPSFFWTGR